MKEQKSDDDKKPLPGCNVNSTFNFTVGGFAIVVAALIGYVVYLFWLR